jgi:hypothetical protein
MGWEEGGIETDSHGPELTGYVQWTVGGWEVGRLGGEAVAAQMSRGVGG